MRKENFKAGNIDEIVWLRLNRLKSVRLCENLIRNKISGYENSNITDELIKSKAIGLSSAIESAIGYWQLNSQSVNAKVLSRYYFLLQMTIAEQVSSVNNNYDLKEVQKHTERGHGLGTIIQPGVEFPSGYFTFAIRDGHFNSYAKFLGIDTKKFEFEKKQREFSKIDDLNKVVSLVDLFRRIPELRNVIEEYTGEPPLSFHVGHSTINMMNELNIANESIKRTGQIKPKEEKNNANKNTYISIYPDSDKITLEYLESLGLPLTNFELLIEMSSKERVINCQFLHSSENHWFHYMKPYKSAYSNSTLIAPLWNSTSDNIVINFTLLYTLSIIVRYLPDLWYRINSGDLDHIGSLIDYYISIIDHVLPLEMLERITGAEISIYQPGSIFGEI